MSRLSDILGVKEGQEFRFRERLTTYRINGDVTNFKMEKQELTEQQITAIKGRIAEGTLWATKRKNESTVWFCKKRPKSFEMPFDAGTACTPLYDFITFKNSPIYLPDLIKR